MRNSTTLNALIFALGLVSVSGCGGGDNDGTASTPIPIAEIDAKFTHSVCAKVFSCCDMAERTKFFEAFNPVPTTVEECENQFGVLVKFAFDSWRSSVSAGRASYDENKAGQCIATVDNTACSDFDSSGGEVCEAMFAGTVAAGQACAGDFECVQGNYCQGLGAPGSQGMCAALPGANEACPDGQCADGTYCKSGTCAALEANGQGCEEPENCQSGYCDASASPAVCAEAPATCDGQ
jgi:Dickkopf N-terminal cysteine-rich region